MSSRDLIRRIGLAIARRVGARIVDQASGRTLGRAVIIPWRGKIVVIGLDAVVKISWLPQDRLTYWKQEIGFTTHPPPDFPKAEAIRQPAPADD